MQKDNNCIPKIDKLVITFLDSLHDFIAEEPRGVQTETVEFRKNVAKLFGSTIDDLKRNPEIWQKMFKQIYGPFKESKRFKESCNTLERYIEITKQANFEEIIKTYQKSLQDSSITYKQCHLLKPPKSPIEDRYKMTTKSVYKQIFTRLKQFMLWNTILQNQLQSEKKITLHPVRKKDYASTLETIINYHQTLNQGDSLLTAAGVILGKSMICNTSAQHLDPSGANYKDTPLLIRIGNKSKQTNIINNQYGKYEQIKFNHPSGFDFIINTYVFNKKIVDDIQQTKDCVYMIDWNTTQKNVLHELEIEDPFHKKKYYIHVFEKQFNYLEPFQSIHKKDRNKFNILNEGWQRSLKVKQVLNENKRAGISITELCKYFNQSINDKEIPSISDYHIKLLKFIFAVKNCGDLLQFKLSEELNKIASGNKYGKIYVHTKDVLAASCAISFNSPVILHSSGSILIIREIDDLYKQYNKSLKQNFSNLKMKRIHDIFNFLNDPVKRLVIIQNPSNGLKTFIDRLSRYDDELKTKLKMNVESFENETNEYMLENFIKNLNINLNLKEEGIPIKQAYKNTRKRKRIT